MAADFTLFRQVKKRGRKASNPSRLLPCSFRYVLMVRSRAEGTKQGYSLPGPRTWDPRTPQRQRLQPWVQRVGDDKIP